MCGVPPWAAGLRGSARAGVLLLLVFGLTSASALVSEGAVEVFPSDETKFMPTGPAGLTYYGYAAAMSDARILIGAPYDDSVGRKGGAAYLYEQDDAGVWIEQKILPSGAAAGDFCGVAVAIQGTQLMIGCAGDDAKGTDAGAIFIYELDGADGWVETKFTASDAEPYSYMGESIVMDGGRALVGAPGNPFSTGVAYLLESDGSGGWVETRIVAPDAAAGDYFGSSVAMEGDRLVVGAPFKNGATATKSGAVYLYELESGEWTATKLMASGPRTHAFLGWSVDVAGSRVVAGAHRDDEGGPDAGAAYLYETDAGGDWAEVQKFMPSGDGTDFGHTVALRGDEVLVGWPGAHWLGPHAGAVNTYSKGLLGDWTEENLAASDTSEEDYFGATLAVDDTVLLASALGHGGVGAAYRFEEGGIIGLDLPA